MHTWKGLGYSAGMDQTEAAQASLDRLVALAFLAQEADRLAREEEEVIEAQYEELLRRHSRKPPRLVSEVPS